VSTRAVAALLLVALLALAACGGVELSTDGGSFAPERTAIPGGSPSAGVPTSPTAASEPPASPSPPPSVDAPPDAFLASPHGSPIRGDLGTYTWGGVVSDAPWIVERSAATVPASTRPTVTFAGTAVPVSWIARWARVRGGEPGRPRAAGRGDGSAPVVVDAPPGPGSWSLRLEARFGAGARATWYWRVRVDG
jgi:hypothetical protein